MSNFMSKPLNTEDTAGIITQIVALVILIGNKETHWKAGQTGWMFWKSKDKSAKSICAFLLLFALAYRHLSCVQVFFTDLSIVF